MDFNPIPVLSFFRSIYLFNSGLSQGKCGVVTAGLPGNSLFCFVVVCFSSYVNPELVWSFFSTSPRLLWILFTITEKSRLSTLLVSVHGAYSLVEGSGFSLRWLLLLQTMDSGGQSSVLVVLGLSCVVCLDQGLNLCPLNWQVNS